MFSKDPAVEIAEELTGEREITIDIDNPSITSVSMEIRKDVKANHYQPPYDLGLYIDKTTYFDGFVAKIDSIYTINLVKSGVHFWTMPKMRLQRIQIDDDIYLSFQGEDK